MVGIPSPEERLTAYPHQFSGGMRQRVAIAIALLHEPDADHRRRADHRARRHHPGRRSCPRCRSSRSETGTALIWITHDLAVVAGLADDIAVMYAGRIVEQGAVDEVLDRPLHPYTRGLIDSVPRRNERGEPLRQIPGMTPSLLNLPPGCAFRTALPARRPSLPERARDPRASRPGASRAAATHPAGEPTA